MAPGSNQEQQPAPEVGGSSTMLNPRAKGFIQNLKYEPGMTEEQKSQANKEFNTQTNAEAGMKAVDSVFPRLAGEATVGQWFQDRGAQAVHELGQVGTGLAGGASAIGLGKLIGVGGAAAGAGEAAAGAGAGAAAAGASGAAALALPVTILAGLGAGAYMYMTKDQRIKYDSDRKTLRSALATALRGVPGYDNEGAIQSLVDSNTPTIFDTDQSRAQKAQNIKDIIRLHTTSSILKNRGYSNN
jgi:hypothetical protein